MALNGHLVLLILSLVCLGLAACEIAAPKVSLLALGLFLFVLAAIVA